MMRQTFTFGTDHIHPQLGLSLNRCYIQTPDLLTRDDCRQWIVDRFGTQWAFQYDNPIDAGQERWDLKEVSWDDSRRTLFNVFGHRSMKWSIRCTKENISDFPIDEVTNGIVDIQVSSHGDNPFGCFVQVIATTPLRGEEVYRKVHSTFREMQELYYN